MVRAAILCLPELLAWTSLLLRVMQEGSKEKLSQGGPKALPIHHKGARSPSFVRATAQNGPGKKNRG